MENTIEVVVFFSLRLVNFSSINQFLIEKMQFSCLFTTSFSHSTRQEFRVRQILEKISRQIFSCFEHEKFPREYHSVRFFIRNAKNDAVVESLIRFLKFFNI